MAGPGGSKPGSTRYPAGGNLSMAKLNQLNFDPITKLVMMYEYLEGEVERQERLRDGSLVELNNAGKPRAYAQEVHHALFDRMIAIGEKLLRYKYGRVPEVGQEEKRNLAHQMVVHLTKKGDTYVIGDEQPDMPNPTVSPADIKEVEDAQYS